MYKIFQSAALMVLVAIGTLACSQLTNDETQLLVIQGLGLSLALWFAADAVRTLWRS